MRRSFIYTAVSQYSPELLSTFVWAYEELTNSFVSGRRAHKSQSGVNDGYPLGPALCSPGFRLILEELIDRLGERGLQQEVPLLAYIDDLFVFGPPERLPQVIDTVPLNSRVTSLLLEWCCVLKLQLPYYQSSLVCKDLVY